MENVRMGFRVLQKINLRSFLGFLISGVLLWLTFRNSGLRLKDIKLDGAQWYYFGTAIGFFIIATWVQSLRAKLLWIDEMRKGAGINTFASLAIGNFYNCLLPGNLGEGIRAWHFSRKQQLPFSSSLAAVITEKWIDAQMFVLLTIVLFTVKPVINNYIFWAICNTSLLILGLLCVYAFMLKYKNIEKFIWRWVIYFRKPGVFLFRLYKYATWQMKSVIANKAITRYVLLCAIILFLNIAQFYFLLVASGISRPVLSIYTAYFVSVSMMIIAIIPSAPGNIGVLHYGIYAVLILCARTYGIEPGSTELQSYALLGVYAHLSFFIPEILIGSVYALRDRSLLFEAELSVEGKTLRLKGK